MKRLLKIMIALLLLEHAGILYKETMARLPSPRKTLKVADEINRKADEIFREIGFLDDKDEEKDN